MTIRTLYAMASHTKPDMANRTETGRKFVQGATANPAPQPLTHTRHKRPE